MRVVEFFMIGLRLSQHQECLRHRTIDFIQDLNKPSRKRCSRPDAIFSRYDIPSFGIKKANHLKIPGRLTKLLEPFPIGTTSVVINGDGLKIFFDHCHQCRIAQNSSTELLAPASAGDLLKKDQNRFSRLHRSGEGRIIIPAPLHFAKLDRGCVCHFTHEKTKEHCSEKM
jgi:hypothetical protein